MRTLAILIALAGAPALAQDSAALKTDPVLQDVKSQLGALRGRVRTMRDRGETWQGRFDRSVGLVKDGAAQDDFRPITNPPGTKGGAAQGDFRPITNPPGAQGGEAAFKPIFNPPAAGAQAPALRQDAQALRAAVSRARKSLQDAAAADAALAALAAATSPAEAEQALTRLEVALGYNDPRQPDGLPPGQHR